MIAIGPLAPAKYQPENLPEQKTVTDPIGFLAFGFACGIFAALVAKKLLQQKAGPEAGFDYPFQRAA